MSNTAAPLLRITPPPSRRHRRLPVLLAVGLVLGLIFALTRAVVPAQGATDATLFGSVVPTTPSAADTQSVELGVRFTPRIDGQVTGLRFYKGQANTGTHTGSLWDSSGARLATVAFGSETATGWQSATFSTPVAVSAGRTYTASYRAPAGGYAAAFDFFSRPYVNADLSVPTDGGVFTYDPSGAPATVYRATNYYVDVLFRASATSSPTPTPSATPTPTPTASPTGSTTPPGNPSGTVAVPSGMGAEDVSRPDRVVGTGTPASCTSAAVVAAVTAGGVVTFNCGPNPTTITLNQTLKVRNSTAKLVLDGGGRITLSGAKTNRILYTDTCDSSLGNVSGNCLYAPSTPAVTVQNITLADGNATKATYVSPGDTGQGSNGGGAIFQLGGRLKVVSSTFVRNVCATNGPDLGGGAIRVLAQHSSTPNDLDASYAARNQDPVTIVSSTFGGTSGAGNSCANGGAISGLRTPVTVINSLLRYNAAVGCCANPAKAGTPGGGSGGAIYTDGNTYNLTIAGSDLQYNSAKAGGSVIFYTSNNQTGRLSIDHSVSKNNSYAPSGQSSPQSFQNYPGIFYIGKGAPSFTDSTVQ